MDPATFIISEVNRLLASPDVTLVNLVAALGKLTTSVLEQIPTYGINNVWETINSELVRRGLPKYAVMPSFAPKPTLTRLAKSYINGVPSEFPFPGSDGLSRQRLFVTENDYLVIWAGRTAEIYVGNFGYFGQVQIDRQGNEYTTDVYNIHPTHVKTYAGVKTVFGGECLVDKMGNFERRPGGNKTYTNIYYGYGAALIELEDNQYVYVQTSVKEFATDKKLEQFFQVTAGNDVSVYAVNADELYYFRMGQKMPRANFTEEDIHGKSRRKDMSNVDFIYADSIGFAQNAHGVQQIHYKTVHSVGK
jgi:hypothetical protein